MIPIYGVPRALPHAVREARRLIRAGQSQANACQNAAEQFKIHASDVERFLHWPWNRLQVRAPRPVIHPAAPLVAEGYATHQDDPGAVGQAEFIADDIADDDDEDLLDAEPDLGIVFEELPVPNTLPR